MKKYKYTKTWMEGGKRKVVRSDDLDTCWMLYLRARYGFTECQRVDMTVEEWVEIALPQYKSNISTRTYQDYKATIKKWILPQIGKKDIGSVTHSDCQKVLNQLQGKSKRTISGIQQLLDFIFKTAIYNNHIKDNPSACLILPQGKEKQKRRALYPEERKALKSLFKGSQGYKFRLFEIMYYTGLRPSECWEITTKDIEEINGHKLLHVKGTKTKAADRYVPWPDALMRYCDKANPDEYICKTEFNTKYNKTSYRRLVERLYREMDILMGAELYRNKIIKSVLRDDFVPYNIRHDFASRLNRYGLSPKICQTILGHSNCSITLDIYQHVDLEDIANLDYTV